MRENCLWPRSFLSFPFTLLALPFSAECPFRAQLNYWCAMNTPLRKPACSVSFILLFLLFAGQSALRAQTLLPLEKGMAVATCFSGLIDPHNKQSGIDTKGFVAGVIDIRFPPPDRIGKNWMPPMYHGPNDSWTAENLGQVFGIAIDKHGSIYLTASNMYGYTYYGPGGPGGVYRLDGVTGEISIFAQLPNAGPGLGNICYSRLYNQFYVTNMEDGMIYRLDSTGAVLDTYDPGRPGGPPDGSIVPHGERLWGIGTYDNELYYSVWNKPRNAPYPAESTIHRIDLNDVGEFLPVTDRMVAGLGNGGVFNGINTENSVVSDIAFAADGHVLFGERTMLGDYEPFAHSSRVLEYLKDQESLIRLRIFQVGNRPQQFSTVHYNCAGGVDYGYGPHGEVTKCDEVVWASGDALRVPEWNPDGGTDWVYGLACMPGTGNTHEDVDETSYYIDLDGDLELGRKTEIGDVEVFRDCCPDGLRPIQLEICPGDSVQLPEILSGREYRWTPSTGLSCTDCERPFASPEETTTYTVQFEYGESCAVTASVVVKVTNNVHFDLDILGPTTFCEGDSVILQAFGDYASYEWSTGSTAAYIIVREPGKYWVRVTTPNGCTGASDTVEVIFPEFATTVTVGDTIICPGEVAVLEADIGYREYLWSTGETTRTIAVGEPGKYWVQVQREDGCIGRSDTITVEQYERAYPKLPIESPVVLCPGKTATFDAGGPYAGYRWSTGENQRFTNVFEPGEYWVDILDENGCWQRSDTVLVIVDSVKVMLPPNLGICIGGEIELDAGPGYAEYNWSTGATSQSITVTASGSYWVEVKNGSGCTGRSNTTTVTVGDELETTIIADNLNLCAGDSAVLDAGPGFEHYRWNTGETTRRIIVKDAGKYFVEIESAGCSGGSDTVEVTIRPVSEPQISLKGETILCAGDSVILDAGEGYVSYVWNTGARTRSITVRESGTYSVMAARPDECIGASAPVEISVFDPPTIEITLSGPVELCEGESVTLTAVTTGGSIAWSDGSTEESITVTESGTYSAEVVNMAGCITRSEEITVTVSPALQAMAGPDVSICIGESIQLSGNGPAGNVRYQWKPAEGLSCTDCPNPVATPTRFMIYTYTVFSETGGCSATDFVRVIVSNTQRQIRAHIPRDRAAWPGTDVLIPLVLDDAPGNESIGIIEVELRYETAIMILEEIVQQGTLSDGWEIEILRQTPGAVRFRLIGPGTIAQSGVLLNLQFGTYLGDRLTSEIPFELRFPANRCLTGETQPGFLRLDSICGLNFRLIENFGSKYSLINRPNPFNPTTDIEFSLGLDGETNLMVLDASGRQVARLFEGYLNAGEYSVTWDATGYPSGLYYCRLTSGHWSAVREMVVVK